jgi:hypothetical protein
VIRLVSTIVIVFLCLVTGFSQTDSTVVIADTIPVINDGNIKNIKTIVENDSVKPHSPKKAMLLSALLPGAGQIYNQKYWKAPIVWAGFVAMGYFINQNNREYHRFKKAYIYNTDGDSTTVSEFPFASPDAIANERNIYRKWRDLSIILTVGWYALNIIDANVDAHLFEFDVSDVATLRWEPTFNLAYTQPNKPFSGGVKFTLGF